jgi:hypothetical protein
MILWIPGPVKPGTAHKTEEGQQLCTEKPENNKIFG